MAENAKKNNKGLIIGICCAVVVVVIVIIVAVVLATSGSGLNDAYFVTDSTKNVITMDNGNVEPSEGNGYTPNKIHTVYIYSGDMVTGEKMYYEYADANIAKAAYDYIVNEGDDGFKEISVDGKYVVFVYDEADYEGLTNADVQNQIDFLNNIMNINADEVVEFEEVEGDTEVVEGTEVVEETTENKE